MTMFDIFNHSTKQLQDILPDGRIRYHHGEGVYTRDDERKNRAGRLSRTQPPYTQDKVKLLKKIAGSGVKVGGTVQMELLGTGNIYLLNGNNRVFETDAEEGIHFDFI